MPTRKSRTTGLASAVTRRRPARGRPAGQAETREHILRAAIEVFARSGFAGARVETISRLARSTDRMIYYYFGSKEKLFVAALETIYKELGDAEAALDLTGLNAEQALRAIVRFTWNHYRTHPELLTLLNNENLHQGRHVARSRRVKELSFPLLSILSEVLARGISEQLFRPDIGVYDLYIAMCSLGYFYLSNRFTLSAFLGRNLMARRSLANWEQVMQEVVARFVCVARARPPRAPRRDPIVSRRAS
jgi:TetR/AcrR family transcriptional regulator, upper aerobic nicotinate degradation pathway regulator